MSATAGQLKVTPEDFVVEEIPAYEPCGEGEHLFIKVRKRGLNTADLIRGLASAFGVDPMAVGSAGLKDKHAITTQWLSVHTPGQSDHATALSAFEAALPGAQVLEAKAHGNKLRTGQLHGNRFELAVRGLRWAQTPTQGALAAAVEAISRQGFINYFGAQRFGRYGDNIARGLRKLHAGRRGRDRGEKLMLSAVQSAVFNVYAATRQQRDQGGLDQVFVGDVLKKTETGGEFICTDAPTDQARLDAHDLVITGPLPGNKAKQAQGLPAQWEDEALAALELTTAQIRAAGKALLGARRPLIVRPTDLKATWNEAEDKLWLSFVLPSGSYATMLLYDLLGLRDTEGLAGEPTNGGSDNAPSQATATAENTTDNTAEDSPEA